MAQRGRPRKKKVEAKSEPKKTKKTTVKSKLKTTPEPEVVEKVDVNVEKEKKVQDFVGDGIIEEAEPNIKDVDYTQPPSQSIPYSPFAQSVEEKEYRTPKVESSPMIGDISEPVFERPSFQDLLNENKEQVEEDGIAGTENSFAQEEVQNLPPKQQEEAAKGLVEQALNLYSLGCKGLGWMAKIKESKVDNLAKEGAIDMSIKVPIDPYTAVTIPQVVEGFNSEINDAFEVTEEFKEEVRPIMTRVFIKRGWGMTDEQQLMFAFGMDIAQKGAIMFQLKKQGDMQIERFIEMTQIANSKRNVNFKPPEADTRRQRPEPTPPPQPQPTMEVVQEDPSSEPSLEDDILRQDIAKEGSDMVAVQNPDIKLNQHDLDQVDVDKV
jgi:hypothetical protein